MPSGPDKTFLEGLYQAMRARAATMAPHFQPGYGAQELDGDDLETLWNHRSLTLEQEWELWRARNPDGTPMYTPELIGSMVFKDREGLIRSGGRVEPKEWIGWANSTAKRMQARREAKQVALEAAPMEPIESVGESPERMV